MRIIFIISFSVYYFSTLAQNTFETIIKDSETEEVLFGATVYFPELEMGTSSNLEGKITIFNIPDGIYKFQVSYIGYRNKEIDIVFPLSGENPFAIIYLDPDEEEMEEVIISSTRSSRTIEDIPTRVEFIAGEELDEKGNMKPGDIRMLLNESTGIQTQQTSATSYNSSIRIQGLDGKYTQLLRDGMPLYSGFSGGLSLMQIAPLDLKQVEVIKGASSTLYGGGAIAGLVNLISKTPGDEREISIMANGTSALGLDLSTYYSENFGKKGATVFASYNKGTPYDPANIGITAIPKFDRYTLNPKLFIYPGEKSTVILGINFVSEKRIGGNIDYARGIPVFNPYFEENNTNRISSQFQWDIQMSEQKKIQFKNTFNRFEREMKIVNFSFNGTQVSSFSELNYSVNNEKTDWVVGMNLWTDEFSQVLQTHDYKNFTWGNFLQNTWSPAEDFSFETGFRLDYHSEYGWFALPKFAFMYNPDNHFTLRLGGGLGYKTPTVFTEEVERMHFENIIPLDNTTGNHKGEKSGGFNLDLNYKTSLNENIFMSSNILFFYTRINNPLGLLPNGIWMYSIGQEYDYLDTKGIEANFKFQFKNIKLFSGYTLANVNQYKDQLVNSLPLVAKHRLNNVLMFEKEENFRIGLEAYYISPQLLSDGETGQAYWVMGLMSEKHIGENLSLFINFENYLDTRQTKFDTIYTGTIESPVFRDIYAPVDGFVVNGGLKVTL